MSIHFHIPTLITLTQSVSNGMENVRPNLAYNLLMKKTKFSSNPINTGSEKITSVPPFNHIYFVICNSCYWCASYFGIDDLEAQVIGCHACNSHNTKRMSVRKLMKR